MIKRNAKALMAAVGTVLTFVAPYAAVLPAGSRAAAVWTTILGAATILGVWAVPNKPAAK